MGPEPETMVWAEITDRFGERWALMDVAVYYDLAITENILRIWNMKMLNPEQADWTF